MSLRSEIAEQPRVVARLLVAGAPRARAIARRLAGAAHVTVAARGSSDNAATYGKYLFEARAGLVTALAAPSVVTLYASPPAFAGGAVIGISQSGAAPDVAEVLAAARREGAFTAAITNRASSRVGRAAAQVLPLGAGPERSIAATKTYTATCAALALIASATAAARGRQALRLDGVVAALEEAVAAAPATARLARAVGRADALVVLGRGFAFAAALETALKVKELARIWAEPYSTADVRHGPIALIEAGTPVLLLAARGATAPDALATIASAQRRGARVLAITDDELVARRADDAVLLRTEIAEELAPIALVVAGQHLAAELARRRGCDPDRPPGLTKVTRTR